VLDGDDKSWANSVRALLITHQRLVKLLDAEPHHNDTEGKEKDVLCEAPLQLRVHGPLKAIVERAKTAIAVWDALNKNKAGTLRVRRPCYWLP
jgi:predicted metal-dependent phosphoesterase TrpH